MQHDIVNCISDVYCYHTKELAYSELLQVLQDGVLRYNDIFMSCRVHLVLLYSFLFKSFFGCLPSKLIVSKCLDMNKTSLVYDDVVSALSKVVTILTFNPAFKDGRYLEQFNTFKTRLKDAHVVKHYILEHLAFRYRTSVPESNSGTLLTFFKSLDMTQLCVPGYCQCPFTGKTVDINSNGDTSCTIFDQLSWIIYTNNYVLRTLIYHGEHVLILVPVALSNICAHLSKKRNKYAIITETAIQDNVWSVDPVYFSLLPEVVPKAIIKEVIVIDEAFIKKELHLDLPLQSLPFSIIEQAIDDYLVRIPIMHNKYIYRLYSQVMSGCHPMGKLASKGACSNAIVLIDNRANALSYISCVITAANLRQDTWHLVIFTSKTAASFYNNLFQKDEKVTILDTLERLNCPVGSFNIEDYNFVMKDSEIWKTLKDMGFKNALIIQDDGMLVRPGIEHMFLDQYDYVGAPWSHQEELVKLGNPMLVGNGGLSLRNVDMHYQITSIDTMDTKMMLFNNDLQPIPEDVYFAGRIYNIKGRIPNTEKASLFSSEIILNPDSIGFHKPWPYHPLQKVDEFFKRLQKME